MRAFRHALRGGSPARYSEDFFDRFHVAASSRLCHGASVLDVGGGRTPTYPPQQRPSGTTYVGLEISPDELQRAHPGSYDEIVIGDVAKPNGALRNRFDLIVSLNVFEHVASLDRAIANLRDYLKPGGKLVAQFAGKYSAHAVLNRAVPGALARHGMGCLLDRPHDTVFEARYDRCDFRSLEHLLERFATYDIVSYYRDATYFEFSRIVRAVYLSYEELAYQVGQRQLASHYLTTAVR